MNRPIERLIKRRIKKWFLLFLGLEDTETDIWALKSTVDANSSSMVDMVNGLLVRFDALPMIDERLRTLEDKLSLIQEAAKPKEEKVIRHRRASEFKQAVERGLHQ